MHEILCENLTREQLRAYCLVLEAYHLPYSVDKTSLGGRIWMVAELHPFALTQIRRYIQENPERPEAEPVPVFEKRGIYSAVWVCLVVIATHGIVHSGDDVRQLVTVYGASAAEILQGELYRAATALMLHADVAHLVGNLAGLALLGTLVARSAGPGEGWLIILLSGISGNLLNALFFQDSHTSIGASTAVFGALGYLAAVQFSLRWQNRRYAPNKKTWLPLAGALALLGFMGTGVHSDLMAHLFGLVAGIGYGVMDTWVFRPHIQDKHQKYGMIAAVVLLALPWLGPLWTH